MKKFIYITRSPLVIMIVALVLSANLSCDTGDIGDLAREKLRFQDISIHSNGVSYINGKTFNFGKADLLEPLSIPVEIKNSGKNPITINALTISGADAADFTYTGTPAGVTLLAGETYPMNLIFTPSAAGPKNAQILLSSTDESVPESVLKLTGVPRQWHNVAIGVSAAAVYYPSMIFRGGELIVSYLNEINFPYIYNQSTGTNQQLDSIAMLNSVRSTYLNQYNGILYLGFSQNVPSVPMVYKYQSSQVFISTITQSGFVSSEIESVNGDIFLLFRYTAGLSYIKLYAKNSDIFSDSAKHTLQVYSGNASMCRNGTTLLLAYADNTTTGRVSVAPYIITNPGDGTGDGTIGTVMNNISAETNIQYVQIKADENGQIYIAYRAATTVYVRKFNGVTWDVAINSGVTTTDRYFAVSNGIPYLAYVSGVNIYVTRYIDGTWKVIGNAPAIPAAAAHPFITFHNGILYLAYKDNDNGGKLSIVKYE